MPHSKFRGKEELFKKYMKKKQEQEQEQEEKTITKKKSKETSTYCNKQGC
jgi:hypothetical protein